MTCKHCGRRLVELGSLGLTDWYRCNYCHHEVTVQIRDEGTYQQRKEAYYETVEPIEPDD
jgi:DNA-directed RNA polymerase subunit RPC12/RpoP